MKSKTSPKERTNAILKAPRAAVRGGDALCAPTAARSAALPASWAGFTIIEIMVAIFIFSLIFAAIYSSWITIMRGSRSALETAAAVQRSRIAVATLEEALSCARAFPSAMRYYSFLAENGDDASLSFVAKLPQSFPRSGRFGSYDVRRLTFSLEPGPDSGRELVLRQNPLLMDLDIDEQEHPVVLAKDVKDFELAFWDLRSGDWIDEWTDTNQLPAMVMFTLRWGSNPSHPGQAREEITRVVALPVTAVPPGSQPPAPIRPGS
jgi:type II secretion system protein J